MENLSSYCRPYEKVDTSEINWSLPNNWILCHFGDIATVINGKNQSKVENPDGKYPIYGSGGIMGRADDFICPEKLYNYWKKRLYK